MESGGRLLPLEDAKVFNDRALQEGVSLEPYLSEETYRQLNIKELATILWYSFMFSQGNSEVQRSILEFARAYYGPQKKKFRISESILNAFYTKIKPKTKKFASPDILIRRGYHVGMDTMEASGEAPGKTKETLSPLFVSNARPEKILPRCFSGILKRDLTYLLERDGRPGDKKKDGSDPGFVEHPLKDKFFSYIIFYVLRGEETNQEWADAMFSAMRAEFDKGNLAIPVELVEKYREHHPEVQI